MNSLTRERAQPDRVEPHGLQPARRRHWDTCPQVETNPKRVGGARCVRNTRLPLSTVYEHLASGASIKEIVEWFPGVTEEQIRAVLNHDAKTLKEDDGWLESSSTKARP